MTTLSKRAVGYLRLSKAAEESTSIDRQREAVTQACAARGWELVDTFEDVDVSATSSGLVRSGLRAARQAVQTGRADVVVVWRLDRLARSVGDFSRIIGKRTEDGEWGLDVASATEPLDTTEPMGRAMAQILQVFAEMEAATISIRSRSSVDYLVRNGRRAGGQVPFGWRNVFNPDGPGKVLALDPERAPLVREAADRVLAGESVGSIAADWSERGVPVPQSKGNGGPRQSQDWQATTLVQLLRRPILAGMTVHRGEVLRGEDGLPLVNGATAVITASERRRLLDVLDSRVPYRPRRGSGNEPALLAGLLWCDGCAHTLYAHRPRDPKRDHRYYCKHARCNRERTAVAVSMTRVDEYVTERFLAAVGSFPVTETLETTERPDTAALAAVEEALRETSIDLAEVDDDAEEAALLERLRTLRGRARELRAVPMTPSVRVVETGETFAEAWASAPTVEARRDLLTHALEEIVVRKGKRGRHGLDPARVIIRWREQEPWWDLEGDPEVRAPRAGADEAAPADQPAA